MRHPLLLGVLAAGTALGQPVTANRPHAPTPTLSVYLYGKVVLDDGTAAPDSVAIERLCNGTVRREAYTDAKGRFSFDTSRTAPALQDTTADSINDNANGPIGTGNLVLTSGAGLNGQAGGLGRLADCDLRAVLPGYRSDVLSLADRRVSNTPDLGTIVLHRLANVDGTVISKTSLEAPPDARKAYEKGREALRHNKPDKARPWFEKAVTIYPKHAAAWHELGRIEAGAGNGPQARQDFEKALAAEPSFLSPYLPLAEIEARAQDWQATVDTTNRLIKLDELDYPQAYYYNALANLRLGKLSEAAASAREAKRLDTAHAFPKIDHVLGMILAEQRDYSGAAAALRDYIEFTNDDHDETKARTQLAAIEKITGPALGVTALLTQSVAGYRAAIHIAPERITLTERDGRWTGQLMLTIGYDDAQRSATQPLPIQLRFTPQVLERVKSAGLTLNRDVRVPAGATTMRVAVRDVPSGALGTYMVDLPAVGR